MGAYEALVNVMVPTFVVKDGTLGEGMERWREEGRRAGVPEVYLRYRILSPVTHAGPLRAWLRLRGEVQPDGTTKIVEKILSPEELEAFQTPGVRSPAIPELSEILPPPPVLWPVGEATPLSISMEDESLNVILDGLASVTRHRARWKDGEIRLEPRTMEVRGALVFRKTPKPPHFSVQPEAVRTAGGGIDLRLLLQEVGVRFCEGATAEYFPDRGEFETRLPTEEDELFQTLIKPLHDEPSLLDRIRFELGKFFGRGP